MECGVYRCDQIANDVILRRIFHNYEWIKLTESKIMLNGVCSNVGEKPMDSVHVGIKWNMKTRAKKILILQCIYLSFIWGLDAMKAFGIKLVEVENIESSAILNNHSDKYRLYVSKLYVRN